MSRERSDSVRSISMSNYLENKEYGIEARNENKRTQLIGQLAEHFFKDSKAIPCGSRAENSTLHEDLDADSDIMGTVKGIFVTEDNHLTFSGYRYDITRIYIIRNKRYPGYCKLQLPQSCYDMLRQKTRTTCYNMLGEISRATENQKAIIASVDKQQEKLLISSELFNKHVKAPGLIPPDSLDEPLFRQNGPAKRNAQVDYVIGFEFITWPQEAKKWKKRHRKHNWPNRGVLDSLESKVSCYVVPIGNKSSEEFHLEWRLSFVEIERELMWNMNDTQFKCYICLKRLKKVYLNEECNGFENISTYQIKNLMFWMCEIIPEYEWKDKYLLRYVLLGLRKLQSCIWLSYNAHYIIPENNIWQNVVLSKQERMEAISLLEILTERSDTIDNIITSRAKCKIDYLAKPACPKVRAYMKNCGILLYWADGCCNEETLEEFYKQMTAKFPETDIYLPCKGISMAKLRWFRFLSFTQIIDLTAYTDPLIRDRVDLMKSGYDMDYLTCSLNIAMVYFIHKKYPEVLKELRSKSVNLPFKVYVTLSGHPSRLFLGKDRMYTFDTKCSNLSDLPTQRQNLVFDFEIGKAEIDFLPFPMKLQRYLFRGSTIRFLVNPLVIGCYLLILSEYYLGHTSEVESTRKLLVSAVSDKYSQGHKYHYFHLYLLGHSYYVTRDRKTAYIYFAQSAIRKPSLINPAIYHIAIMINNEIRTRKPKKYL